jgi:hypothetical protein
VRLDQAVVHPAADYHLEPRLDVDVLARTNMGIAADLIEKAAVPQAAGVEQFRAGPAQDTVVPDKRARRLEEAARRIKLGQREAQAMRQVDVVIVPHRDEVVPAHGDCGVSLLAQAAEALRRVDDSHLRMVEDDGLVLKIIEDQEFLRTRIILIQKRVNRFFEHPLGTSVRQTHATDWRIAHGSIVNRAGVVPNPRCQRVNAYQIPARKS